MTQVVAQNFGAKKEARLDQVVAYAGRMTVYWGGGFYILILFGAGTIASIFTDNQEVLAYAKNYLIIVGLSFPAIGLALISTSFFTGVYQAKVSLKLTLTKALLMTIPFALLGNLFGLTGLWTAFVIANIAGAVYGGRLLFAWQRENNSALVGHNPLSD